MKLMQKEKSTAVKAKGGAIAVIRKNIFLYILLLPIVLSTFIFAYLPLPGLLMSFMEYDVFKGFSGSPWVGLDNIKAIISLPSFWEATLNTIQISVYNLTIVFVAPIIFALLLNEVKQMLFKRVVQTVSYLPHFLSWIAIIGISTSVFSTYGIVNDLRLLLGGEGTERVMYLANQSFFVPHVILLSLWKSTGWNSVIYIAAISGIDEQLYEAACVDGAGKLRQCISITIPSIMPTAVMLFILAIGGIFKDNFDLIYGLQNAFIDFETITTIVYKQGIENGQYSMSTAIGFMQGVIGFVLVIFANKFSKKVNDVALW